VVTLPLRVTAALMQHCSFFVSNDSGLMHVAVSQKIPTFGLFGPTDERRTAPWGPYGHVIRAEGTKSTYDVGTLKEIRNRHEPDASLLALDVKTVVNKINTVVFT
jgi:ADP-heptose:LPS heptosyltransferase